MMTEHPQPRRARFWLRCLSWVSSRVFAIVVGGVLLVTLAQAVEDDDATSTLGVAALVVLLWILRGVDPRLLRTIKAGTVELGYAEQIEEAGAALTDPPTPGDLSLDPPIRWVDGSAQGVVGGLINEYNQAA